MYSCQKDSKPVVGEAVRCLQAGGVLVYPTETVYGLGGDPFHKDVVERIRAIKEREENKGFLLLIPTMSVLEGLVGEIPEVGQQLMERFWPGPLTFVLKGRSGLPSWLIGEDGTVALRVSSDPVVQAIVAMWGRPLISTSANRSGYPPALSVERLDPAIAGAVDLVIDGGCRSCPHPSTIVDVSSGGVRMVRVGQVSAEEIEQIIGQGHG
ncbi:MAG: threonylcarbamoyl-AMP synthase [Candidatus Latescibacteria bacterium]|nr:threonylcarbamoyl-AMP synthase [Candidatus Latescibacterota bacterium]